MVARGQGGAWHSFREIHGFVIIQKAGGKFEMKALEFLRSFLLFIGPEKIQKWPGFATSFRRPTRKNSAFRWERLISDALFMENGCGNISPFGQGHLTPLVILPVAIERGGQDTPAATAGLFHRLSQFPAMIPARITSI